MGEESIYKESIEKCFDMKDKCFGLKRLRREIEFGSFDETKSMIMNPHDKKDEKKKEKN